MIDISDKFIINGDIKPDNIMVQRGNILVTDWSVAKTVVLPTTTIKDTLQTIWYRAPERIMNTHLEKLNTDVWSLGIVILELLLDIPGLLSGKTESDVLSKMAYLFGEESFQCYSDIMSDKYKNIIKGNISRLHGYLNIIKKSVTASEFELAKDLIQKMLDFDPNKRATFIDVYNHKFLGNTPIKAKSLLDKLDNLQYITVNLTEIKKNNNNYQVMRNYCYDLINKLCSEFIDGISTELCSCTLKLVDIIAEKIVFDKTMIDRYVIYAFDISCGIYSFYRPYMCSVIKQFDTNYNKKPEYIANSVYEYNNICRILKYNANSNTGICYVRLLEECNISDITLYRKIYLEIQKSLCGLTHTDRVIARISMYIVKSIKNINNEQINIFIGNLVYHELIIANKFLGVAKLIK
jgi:serine/threonine protein kinase